LPSGLVNFSITSLFVGTTSYVSTFVAQYFGAARYERIGPVIWQGLYISILGALIVAAFIPLAGPIFHMVGHQPAVRDLEIVYFRILCLGGLPVIGSAALSGFFSGLGRPWPVMWINCLSTFINLVLDYAMIFATGASGKGQGRAAWARSSRQRGFLIYLPWCSVPSCNRLFRTTVRLAAGQGPVPEAAGLRLPFRRPVLLDMYGLHRLRAAGGALGTVNLAATNIAFNINTLAFLPMIGSGIAISVLVGQYLGQNRPTWPKKAPIRGFTSVSPIWPCWRCPLWWRRIFCRRLRRAGRSGPVRGGLRADRAALRFVAFYSLFDALNIIFASAINGRGRHPFRHGHHAGGFRVHTGRPDLCGHCHARAGIDGRPGFWPASTSPSSASVFSPFRGGKWKAMRVIEEPVAAVMRNDRSPRTGDQALKPRSPGMVGPAVL
jgi:MATE family multidrug resistance protein